MLENLKEQQTHQKGPPAQEKSRLDKADSAYRGWAKESDNNIQSIDGFSSVAPISVVRQVEIQACGRRRVLEISESDLVANGLLDEQESNDLIRG